MKSQAHAASVLLVITVWLIAMIVLPGCVMSPIEKRTFINECEEQQLVVVERVSLLTGMLTLECSAGNTQPSVPPLLIVNQ